MHTWLSRLSFSFLILAAVAGWAGHRAARQGHSPTLHYTAAMILVAAGVVGLRNRHRSG